MRVPNEVFVYFALKVEIFLMEWCPEKIECTRNIKLLSRMLSLTQLLGEFLTLLRVAMNYID